MAATEIIDIDALKTWLAITGSTEDAILEIVVAAANEAVENFCETKFTPTPIENELHDASRADAIVPSFWPMRSVERLALYPNADGSGGTTVEATQYIVREEEVVLKGQHVPRGRGLVVLDYTYGFTEPPANVKLATLLTAEAYYRMRMRKSVGITSKSKEGESINYSKAFGDGTPGAKANAIPTEAQGLLQDYRAVGFPSPTEMATRRV